MGFGSKAIDGLAKVPRCQGVTGEQADTQALNTISNATELRSVFFM